MTAATALDTWLRALPKAEMHVHFEGADTLCGEIDATLTRSGPWR